jgi:thymidylate synthase
MNVSKQFKNIISDVEEYGSVSQPRDLKVKELLLHTVEFDPTQPFANFENRAFNWKYFAGELAWYMSKNNDIDYINKFSNFWKGITNPNTNEINSNYGSLIFGKQLQWVKDSLIADKNTRQAIAFFNQPKFQFEGNKDFVCTMYMNFFIRDNKLNMKVQMRSNDIFYGLTFDAPFFALVHQHVYLWIKDTYSELELGTYFHCADNIHFYERHFELADSILHETNFGDIKTYKFELKEPLFEIEDSSMKITQQGAKLIAAINHGIDKGYKRENYEKILSEYLNIKSL